MNILIIIYLTFCNCHLFVNVIVDKVIYVPETVLVFIMYNIDNICIPGACNS
jgi:hypothetical protein